MTKNIFIASAEAYSGKSIVALGLVNMLLGKAKKIGYFKPIINQNEKEKRDSDIETILKHFNLPVAYEDTYAFTRQEALQRIENDSEGEMLNTIISKFKKMEDSCDFIVIEGSDFVGEGTAFEFEANALIAKNLGAPAFIVVSGDNKTTAQVVNAVLSIWRNFEQREVQVLGIFANKVKAEQVNDVQELLRTQLPVSILLVIIPMDKGLLNPTMKEIYEHLGGKSCLVSSN